ncbi:DNA internalization-related competence protein ComEC/Rec2 [Companilactobacillus zhongbaensis]|uniref:DNA internalization-related competence protein ComEC/Rec2 n=1 Tax=Companilactobacillus zhongbaensis TaxID=2486009 RepID=UPI000F7B53BA|nr:DNA internalization-related competence protein ComEC/Rec2 [Companilactobacillus zhongbaensis]
MRGYWIFSAIMATGMSFLIFNDHFVIASLALILFLIRIYYLKKTKIFLCSTVIMAVFGIYFFTVDQHLDAPPLTKEVKTATIYPDEIHVNGDSLSGKFVHEAQYYQFFNKLSDQETQKSWQSLDHAVDCRIVDGEISYISGPRNPGEFDFKTYSNHRGIFESVKSKKIVIVREHQARDFADWIHLQKIKFLNYLSRLPKWLKIHAQGLLVGYTSQDARELYQVLSVLGVIHLFSLSGLHIFILITFLYKASSFCRLPKEWIEWTFLIILPIYGIFVGLKTGISRAIVLALLAIVFKKIHLKISSLDVFSLTVLICLLLDPFCFIEMGGQLSFILSGALLFLKEDQVFMTTIKMNLLSMPIVSFYTYQLNLLIVLMNLIFVPLFNYLIIPTVILSALFLNYLPKLWDFFNQIFEGIYGFLNVFANDSNLNFIVGKFPIISILALVVIALFNIEHKKLFNRYFRQYLMVFLISLIWVKFPLYGSVSMIDVGQGDSILVTTPLMRQTMLIDTGGTLSFAKKPWQEKKTLTQVEKSTLPYLKSLGVSHIDRVFLSHKDTDHIGNIEVLLDKFPVNQVSFGTGLQQNKRISDLIKNNPRTVFTKLKQGDRFSTWPINWQVLWPNKPSIGENPDSLTMLAQIKQTNWLFTGDLDQDSEHRILKEQAFRVDILKAGHHGSKTSTSEQLLDMTEPKLALISAGINNRYGHPNKETIQRLDKYHVQHLNTAEYGMITWYYFPFSNYQKLDTFIG